MIYIAGIFGFFAGCFIGAYFKKFTFDNQDWKVMKWDQNTFGYRPVPMGTLLRRGDKLKMCLDLDSSQLPKEGLKLE